MKYAIKRGPAKGQNKPLYWTGWGNMIAWEELPAKIAKFHTRAKAEKAIKDNRLYLTSAKVVRILSPMEAKRKFAAGVLREMAGDAFGLYATDLRMKADELWPVKGKR